MFRETFLHYLKHNRNRSRSTRRSTKQCSYRAISSSNNFRSKLKCSPAVCFCVFNHLHTLTCYDHIPVLAFGCWNKFTQIFQALLIRRSEEHTSELQSRGHLVCRLLLEKKNQKLAASNEP